MRYCAITMMTDIFGTKLGTAVFRCHFFKKSMTIRPSAGDHCLACRKASAASQKSFGGSMDGMAARNSSRECGLIGKRAYRFRRSPSAYRWRNWRCRIETAGIVPRSLRKHRGLRTREGSDAKRRGLIARRSRIILPRQVPQLSTALRAR